MTRGSKAAGKVVNGAAKLWGEELQFWRRRAGLTQEQLAARTFCDQSWISALERGKAVPSPELAQKFDEVLDTSGVLLRGLKFVARESSSQYHPDWFQDYVELEREALHLHEWYPYGIPGLLQTEPYMRQQFAGWHGPGRVDELTEARLSRLERLYGDDALRVHALIDESVLRRKVGGVEVLAPQLAHLLRMSARPNITIQVVPLDRPITTSVDSMVAFLGMPDGQTWFYTEGLDHGRITADHRTVAEHRERYDALRASALPSCDSRQVIRRTMEEMVNVTPEVDLSNLNIFKSSYSGGGNGCVGTSRDLLAAGIAPVVDTTLGLSSPVLAFSTNAFASFVSAVKAREFTEGEQYVTP